MCIIQTLILPILPTYAQYELFILLAVSHADTNHPQAQYVFIHKAIQEVLEAEAGMNGGGFSQNGFSQSGNYPVYVNRK